jgi:rare lipoprotein A
MKTLKRTFLILALTGWMLMIATSAHARSGRAAYHFHSNAMITAARYEPIGSVLRVTNPQNGRSVTVRVVDRGPFNGNRILDLSTGAFSQLYGGLKRGVGPVRYTVVSRGGNRYRSQKVTRRHRTKKVRRVYKHRRSRR